jgi:hypothetical protein
LTGVRNPAATFLSRLRVVPGMDQIVFPWKSPDETHFVSPTLVAGNLGSIAASAVAENENRRPK